MTGYPVTQLPPEANRRVYPGRAVSAGGAQWSWGRPAGLQRSGEAGPGGGANGANGAAPLLCVAVVGQPRLCAVDGGDEVEWGTGRGGSSRHCGLGDTAADAAATTTSPRPHQQQETQNCSAPGALWSTRTSPPRAAGAEGTAFDWGAAARRDGKEVEGQQEEMMNSGGGPREDQQPGWAAAGVATEEGKAAGRDGEDGR